MEVWVFIKKPVAALDLAGAHVDLSQCAADFSEGVAPDIGWQPRSDARIWMQSFSVRVLRDLLDAVEGDLVVWDESEREILRREGGKVTVQPHGFKGLDELATA